MTITFSAEDLPDGVYFVSIAGHQPDWKLDDRSGVWVCGRVWPSGDPCATERPVGADLSAVTCQRRHVAPLGQAVDEPVDREKIEP